MECVIPAAYPNFLDRLVRETNWTIEETCARFERAARDMGEDATLSKRQILRWMRGDVGRARPVARRVAERFWGHPWETLMGPAYAASALAPSTSDRLTSKDALPDLPLMDVPGGVSGTALVPEGDFDELVQVFVMWAQNWDSRIGRRDVLAKLSAVVTAAAALPLFNIADDDERDQVASFVQDPSRFDEPALRYCEGTVTNLRRQSDVLGPALTLQSAMGHRELAYRLAKVAPAGLRPRALSAYAELTQLIGWLHFNLGDYRSAQRYYDEARTAAHDAEDVELVTFVLCTMSHLASWQGRPRVGIDHAAAAAVWAEQSGSPLARAYATNVAVRAYLADGQRDRCRAALDTEYATITGIDTPTPPTSRWYFYDESFHWSTRTQYALGFNEPATAMEAIETSLRLSDPANLHERAHRSLYRAEALLQQGEIAGAAGIVGEVAGITAMHASGRGRVDQRVGALRKALVPWQRTRPVRELDEVLAAYRPPAIGSGKK